MSGLPKGWAEVTLADVVADIVGGGTPSKSHAAYFEGEIPFMTVKDMNVRFPNDTQDKITQEALANSSARLVPAGTIVVATRMGLGKAVRPIIDTAINQDLKAIFPSAAISTEYLHWKLLESAPYLLSLGTGTTVKGIRLEDLRGLPIPLPPLPEQKRIVAKVDGLTARTARARADLDRIPTLIARYKKRLLALAFSGELTAGWRQGNAASAWESSTVAEVASIVFDGPFGSNLKSDDYVDSGVRVVRLENIGALNFIREKETYISQEKFASLKRHELMPGDVLFSSFISEEIRVCLFPSDLETAAINKADCFCIRVNPAKCSAVFLAYKLASPTTYEVLKEEVHGATRPRISLSHLRSFTFDLPSKDEQAEIVSLIESAFNWLDRMAADHAAAVNLLPKLDATILAKAFRGELVPQNPTDEPASILLDRIQAERAATPKQVRLRKPRTLAPQEVAMLPNSDHDFSEVIPRTPGASAMTKSRQDDDVMGKPYLANLLKAGHGASAQDLFKAADLPVADFYKQLAWEIAQKHIRDDDEKLEAL